MQPKKKILILDDHPVFRKGLAQLINEEDDMIVCAEAESVKGAIHSIKGHKPDLAIVDITLKNRSGMELIYHLKIRKKKLPVLVISMHDESLYAERVLRAGALGYITKQEMTRNVTHAIRHVLSGNIYLSQPMLENMVGKLVQNPENKTHDPVGMLTNRELEVFRLIGQGLKRKDIADTLHLSVKTIGTYRETIKKKLNFKNATELMKHAVTWEQKE